MKQPIVSLALRQASRLLVARRDLRDAERSIAGLARSMRLLTERHTEVAEDRDVWMSRAKALYAACPADVRDEVLATLETIGRLPVVDGPRSAP